MFENPMSFSSFQPLKHNQFGNNLHFLSGKFPHLESTYSIDLFLLPFYPTFPFSQNFVWGKMGRRVGGWVGGMEGRRECL